MFLIWGCILTLTDGEFWNRGLRWSRRHHKQTLRCALSVTVELQNLPSFIDHILLWICCVEDVEVPTVPEGNVAEAGLQPCPPTTIMANNLNWRKYNIIYIFIKVIQYCSGWTADFYSAEQNGHILALTSMFNLKCWHFSTCHQWTGVLILVQFVNNDAEI